jgi:hypothetical protein
MWQAATWAAGGEQAFGTHFHGLFSIIESFFAALVW